MVIFFWVAINAQKTSTKTHCGPLRFIKSRCLANDIPLWADLIPLVVGKKISFKLGNPKLHIPDESKISQSRCLPYWLGISTQHYWAIRFVVFPMTHCVQRIAAPGPRRLAALTASFFLRRTMNHQNLLKLQTNLYVCHTSIHLCMQVRMYTYIHTYTCVYIHTYIHIRTYAYIRNMVAHPGTIDYFETISQLSSEPSFYTCDSWYPLDVLEAQATPISMPWMASASFVWMPLFFLSQFSQKVQQLWEHQTKPTKRKITSESEDIDHAMRPAVVFFIFSRAWH